MRNVIPKLSILIPSVRPKELYNCMSSIRDNTLDIDYEIICITDFMPDNKLQNKYIYQPIRRGVVNALNLGFDMCDGTHLLSLSDEMYVEGNSIGVTFQKLLEEEREEPRVMADFILASPNGTTQQNAFTYWGKKFCPAPMISREYARDLVNGFMSKEYKCFYADPDLSLRCLYDGGRIIEPVGIIYHKQNMNDKAHIDNIASHQLDDRRVFKKAWEPIHGEFQGDP